MNASLTNQGHEDQQQTIVRRLLAPVLLTLAVIANGTGCTKSQIYSESLAEQTGSELTEAQVAMAPVELKAGAVAYISADSVRVRPTPESGREALGRLYTNDKVQIVEAEPVGKDEYIRVRVLETNSNVTRAADVYVAQKFLNATVLDVDALATSAMLKAEPGPRVVDAKPIVTNRVFIVTNLATDVIRVYQRCMPTEGCVNRMIMEAKVVNGEAKDGTRTNVGFFQIESWTKFYETSDYPAWYKPGYPPVPGPGNLSAWKSSQYMPNGQGEVRGAFGWFTAKVAPRADGQWTHGTAGWGDDKTKFIDWKDTFWGGIASIFANVHSHGCTRTDNEAIAFIRQLAAVGTPLIKVYAREGYRDPSRRMYTKTPGRWEYILTKNGAQQVNKHQRADRDEVWNNSDIKEWLDSGTYAFDQYPDARDKDVYGLGEFHGTFLIDEGRLYQYSHPSNIGRGGFSDQIAPPYMLTDR